MPSVAVSALAIISMLPLLVEILESVFKRTDLPALSEMLPPCVTTGFLSKISLFAFKMPTVGANVDVKANGISALGKPPFAINNAAVSRSFCP